MYFIKTTIVLIIIAVFAVGWLIYYVINYPLSEIGKIVLNELASEVKISDKEITTATLTIKYDTRPIGINSISICGIDIYPVLTFKDYDEISMVVGNLVRNKRRSDEKAKKQQLQESVQLVINKYNQR